MKTTTVASIVIVLVYCLAAALATAGMKVGLWLIVFGWSTVGVLILIGFGMLLLGASVLFYNTMAEARRHAARHTAS